MTQTVQQSIPIQKSGLDLKLQLCLHLKEGTDWQPFLELREGCGHMVRGPPSLIHEVNPATVPAPYGVSSSPVWPLISEIEAHLFL